MLTAQARGYREFHLKVTRPYPRQAHASAAEMARIRRAHDERIFVDGHAPRIDKRDRLQGSRHGGDTEGVTQLGRRQVTAVPGCLARRIRPHTVGTTEKEFFRG